MWMVENTTRYAAERNWFLDKDGAKSWVVAVKATFDILPDGATTVAKKQLDPLYAEEYTGEPGTSSVLYESDLTGPKSATDVLLNGHAYAPKGKATPQVDVVMTVHRLTKTLRVFGDRVWEKGMAGAAISAPKAFDKVPIVYERAFGGWDRTSDDPKNHRLEPRNPVGTGFATRREHAIGAALPNIEDPAELISAWSQRPRPAGFGAISSYWLPRRELAGTYDEKWQKERFPLWAEDFDDAFFQVAPEDQRAAGFLRGGEKVELRNLSPSGSLRFTLPKVHPVFTTYFRGRGVEHRAKLHTVILEPDQPRVVLVWYTSLPCQHKADDLDVTVVREKRFLE
jgi:hypothetical protein